MNISVFFIAAMFAGVLASAHKTEATVSNTYIFKSMKTLHEVPWNSQENARDPIKDPSDDTGKEDLPQDQLEE